jgi:hypothetical protein
VTETTSEASSIPSTVPTSGAGPATTSSGGNTSGGNTSGGSTGGSQGGGGSTGDNGGGSTGDNGGGGAAGSPIDVPTIPDKHTSMDGLKPAIEGAFAEACGGTLCVHLVYTDGACLLGYDPSDRARRGSTVTVLTESQQDCDAANGVTPPETDTTTTGTPTGPVTDSHTETSDQTAPPGSEQTTGSS